MQHNPQPPPAVFGVRPPSSRRPSVGRSHASSAAASDDDEKGERPYPKHVYGRGLASSSAAHGFGTVDNDDEARAAALVQQYEDGGDYPTALHLRHAHLSALAQQRAAAAERLRTFGGRAEAAAVARFGSLLLEGGDEYLRRLNFYALSLANQREFREAARLLLHAARFVAASPADRPINFFSDTVETDKDDAVARQHKRVLHRAAATIESNRGLVAFKAGRLSDAEIHFFAAAAMEERLGADADNPAATLFNLAQVEAALGKHPSAADCAEAATEVLEARLADPRLLLLQAEEARLLLLRVLFVKAAAERDSSRFGVAIATLEKVISVAHGGGSDGNGDNLMSPTGGGAFLLSADGALGGSAAAAANGESPAAMAARAEALIAQMRSAAKVHRGAPRPYSARSVSAAAAAGASNKAASVRPAGSATERRPAHGAGLLAPSAPLASGPRRPLSGSTQQRRPRSASAAGLQTATVSSAAAVRPPLSASSARGGGASLRRSTNANEAGANAGLAPFYRQERAVTTLAAGGPAAEVASRVRAASLQSAAIDAEYEAILGAAYTSTSQHAGSSSRIPSGKQRGAKDEEGEAIDWGQGQGQGALSHLHHQLQNVGGHNAAPPAAQAQQRPPSVTFVDDVAAARAGSSLLTPSPTGSLFSSSALPHHQASAPDVLVPSRPTTAPKVRPTLAARGDTTKGGGIAELRESAGDDDLLGMPAARAAQQQQQQQQGTIISFKETAANIPPPSLGADTSTMTGAHRNSSTIARGQEGGVTEDLILAAATKLSGGSSSQHIYQQYLQRGEPTNAAGVLATNPGLRGIYGSLSPRSREAFDALAATRTVVTQPSSDRSHLSPNRQFPWTPTTGVLASEGGVVSAALGTGRSRVGDKPRLPSPAKGTATASNKERRNSPPSNTVARRNSPPGQPFSSSQQQQPRRPSITSHRGSISAGGEGGSASFTTAAGGRPSTPSTNTPTTILYSTRPSEALFQRATDAAAREIAAELAQAVGRAFFARLAMGVRRHIAASARLRLREEVRREEQLVAERRAAEIIREHEERLEARRHLAGANEADDVARRRAALVAAASGTSNSNNIGNKKNAASSSSTSGAAAAQQPMVGDDIMALFKASVVNIPTARRLGADGGSSSDFDSDDDEAESSTVTVYEEAFEQETDAGTGAVRNVLRRKAVGRRPREAWERRPKRDPSDRKKRRSRDDLGAHTDVVTAEAVEQMIHRQRHHAGRLQAYHDEQHAAIAEERRLRDDRLRTLARVQAALRAKVSTAVAAELHEEARIDLLEAYANRRLREHAVAVLVRHEGAIAEAHRARAARRNEEAAAIERRAAAAKMLAAFAAYAGSVREVTVVRLPSRAASLAATVQSHARTVVAQMLTRLYFAEDTIAAHRAQSAAATVVQTCYRGFVARWLLRSMLAEAHASVYANKAHYAASKIQATYRMHRYGKPIRPLLAEHAAMMMARAEAEARRLRLRAVAPVIQRAYRCHLARRAADFLRRSLLERRRDYLSLAIRDDAARCLQRFALVVAARAALRRQRSVMAEIIAFRAQQQRRAVAERIENGAVRVALALLQRVGRGFVAGRRPCRAIRVRRVAEWDALVAKGEAGGM